MAFYKLCGKFVATYESCSTAAFKHGRTETIRPLTMTTKTCTEQFNSRQKPSANELRALLNECTKVHNQLTKDAAMGQGFDRHLFGLKIMAEKHGGPLPEIYQDPVNAAANYFILSTSTLHGSAFSGGGFGPVVKDGFGLGYGFSHNTGCLASTYSQYRNGSEFIQALESSLDDIYNVLEKSKNK